MKSLTLAPPVHPEGGDPLPGVPLHGGDEVGGLVGDALQGGPAEVGPGGPPGEAHHGPPGVHVPVGRPQAGEGGDQIDPPVVRDGGGQHVAVAGLFDEPQLVPEPLDGGAGVEHAALQDVGGLAPQAPAHAGEQAVLGAHRGGAGVHQGEAAGAVGVLQLARGKAPLAEEGGLLVPRHAPDGQAGQGLQMGHPGGDHPQVPAVLHRPGEEGQGHLQQLAQGLVPLQAVDVKEHGAAAVGKIRGVDPAPGEVPQQPAVHGAAEQLPCLRPPPGARDVVQQPAVLGAGEVGVGEQPRPGPDGLGVPLLPQLGAQVRRPAALPDDGAAHRLAGGPLPEQGGLPLVGQAQGGDVPGGPPRWPPRTGPPPGAGCPAAPGGRAPPSRAGDSAGGRGSGPWRPPPRPGQREWPGSWWCPGPGPGDSPSYRRPPILTRAGSVLYHALAAYVFLSVPRPGRIFQGVFSQEVPPWSIPT